MWSNYQYLSYSKLLEQACFLITWTGTELRFDRVDIQQARIKYWWSFLWSLWIALSHADMVNATKIIDTFYNYIIDYYVDWLLNCSEKITND